MVVVADVSPVRLDSLTSLRFFAALIVVADHLGYLVFDGTPFRAATSQGYLGVTFFFALSGFVLAWTWRPEAPVGRFWQKRAARILPLHIATAIAALVVVVLTTGDVPFKPSIANLLLLQSWIPSETYGASLNPVSWSLSCEAFFYLAFPFLFLALRRRASRWALLIIGVWLVGGLILVGTLDPLHAQSLLYKFPAYRIGEFAAGVVLAIAMKRGFRVPVGVIPAIIAALVAYASLVVLAPAMSSGGILSLAAVPDLIALPFVLLLLAAAAGSDLCGRRGVLRSPVLIRLGEASFALYLIHFLPLEFAGPVLRTLDGSAEVVAAAALVALLVVASLGVYRWFERPVERALRPRPSVNADRMADASAEVGGALAR